MKTIYKYPLRIQGHQILELPKDQAQILHVGEQNGSITVWAIINTEQEEMESHNVWIYGTGHDIEDAEKLKHLGTVQMRDGLVWHVFLQVIP